MLNYEKEMLFSKIIKSIDRCTKESKENVEGSAADGKRRGLITKQMGKDDKVLAEEK